MITAEQSTERFSIRHQPRIEAGERATWGCIDERNMLLRGLLLRRDSPAGRITLLDRRRATNQSILYKQTAGGPFGVGQDINISLRLAQQNNSRADFSTARQIAKQRNAQADQYDRAPASIAPSYVLGSAGAKALRAAGIDLLAHKGCAAEMSAETIAWGIATGKGPNGEDVYDAIKDMRPGGFKKGRFMDIQGAYQDALADGMVASLEESTPAMEQGAETPFGIVLPVGRAALTGINHISPTMLMDWRQNVAFDVESAVNASDIDAAGIAMPNGDVWASYHASMGDMHQLTDVIQGDLFPAISHEDFSDAAFVRNGATSLFLPRQVDAETPVQLHLVA